MDRLTSLEAFVAVVDLGSFTKAATRLRLSPSMVTAHVSRLEERLGVKLLNRTTRRLDLTQQGRSFLDSARQILDSVAAAESAVRRGDNRPVGRVRIDAPALMGALYVAPALAQLKASFPDIVLDLTLGDRGTVFRTDGFDILIRVGEAAPSDHVTMRGGDTRFILVAAPDYLTRRGRPATPQDVLAHDCILYASLDAPGGNPWRFRAGDEMIRLHPPASLTCNDGGAIAEAAIEGIGLAQTLEMLVRRPLADGRLVQVLEHWAQASIPVVLTCAADRYRLPAVNAVMRFLAEEVPWGLAAPHRAG